MKVLSVTTLFPSQAQPVHAVFVYNRIAHVAQHCELRVIAPIPYFPFERFIPKFASRKFTPREDTFKGIKVYYPRFLSIPATLKPLDGFFILLAIWWTARKIKREFAFEILDCHLPFPEGFAGVFLARLWKIPVSMMLRGHDINVLGTDRFPLRKRQIQFALRNADLVIGVADSLRRGAVKLGAIENKSCTISNGVDRSIFHPIQKTVARERLGLPKDRKIVLSIGRIVENKGHHLIVEALANRRDTGEQIPLLVIVGGLADEALYPARLDETIKRLKMEEHVKLAGAQLNDTLRDWYSAADIFCLASAHEGWPNVMMEALACGTPIVSTKIESAPEILTSEDYGILVERTVEGLANGLSQALQKEWKQELLVEYVSRQSWEAVAEKTITNFKHIIAEKSA